jgi:hypothetical protein
MADSHKKPVTIHACRYLVSLKSWRLNLDHAHMYLPFFFKYCDIGTPRAVVSVQNYMVQYKNIRVTRRPRVLLDVRR